MTTTPASRSSRTARVRRDDFTHGPLDWRPWLDPPAEATLTARQRHSLLQPSRAHDPHYRLLAEDPDLLEARTRTEFDIFHSTRDGLPRGERELAATIVARVDGGVYAASEHARFAAHHSHRRGEVHKLLEEGPGALIADAAVRPLWAALTAAVAALATTPVSLDADHLAALHAAGLDDLDILDAIAAGAWVAWADRALLTLGEPVAGTQERRRPVDPPPRIDP